MNERLFKRFVSGKEIEDAIDVAKKLERSGVKTAIDHLGEEIKKKEDVTKAVREYVRLLEKINKSGLDSHISIKLSQLGLAIDENLAKRNMKLILEKAKKFNLGVEIDVENHLYTQRTIEMYLSFFSKYRKLTLCVQAYFIRSEEYVKEILRANGNIRLVKGIYKERVLAYTNKEKIRKNYVKLMKLIIEKGNFLVIATHDKKIILEAVNLIKKYSVPKNKYEFEMLYGFDNDLMKKVSKEHPLRVYLPYGKEWKACVSRRLKELNRH